MKLLCILLILFFSIHAYAGMGDYLVYKAKYVLTNGTTVTGFLPLFSDEDYSRLENNTNKYCNDKSFQKLINTVFYRERHTLVFNIYTELHSVNYEMASYYQNYSNPINCSFTDSSSVIQLNLDSIKYTIFLEAKPADWDWSVDIEVIDRKTSLMMQNNSALSHTYLGYNQVSAFPDSIYHYNFDSYFAINYNKNLSLDDFMDEMEKVSEKIYAPDVKFLKSTKKNQESFNVLQQKKQQVAIPLVKKLRQRGIILIQVHETG